MEVAKSGPRSSSSRGGRSDPRRHSRRKLVAKYYSRRHRVRTFYDEDQDYSFAERVEPVSMADSDFQWYEGAVGDTIDDMSSALTESQKKAVRWRIVALRALGIVLLVILLAGVLPFWAEMLRRNRTLLEHQHDVSYCRAENNADESHCVFYNHELSTYNAFVGLWLFTSLCQCLVLLFTSWRLHNKSFQALVSIFILAVIIIGIVVMVYSVVVVCLMAEPFNWRVASLKDEFKIAVNHPIELKRQFLTAIYAVLSLDLVLIGMQIAWLFFMRQLLQYGLNLQEFGAEMCGADVEEATHENALAMQSAVGSLLNDDELAEKTGDAQRNASQRKQTRRTRVMNHRSSGSRGNDNDYNPRNRRELEDDEYISFGSGSDSEDGDFEFLDDSDYDESHGEENNDSNANAQPQVNMGQVLEMMTALTNTMSSLNHKIEHIESRVGDGSALLVMPPGENQWDAKKGR